MQACRPCKPDFMRRAFAAWLELRRWNGARIWGIAVIGTLALSLRETSGIRHYSRAFYVNARPDAYIPLNTFSGSRHRLCSALVPI